MVGPSFRHRVTQLFVKAQKTVDDNKGHVAIIAYAHDGQLSRFSHPSMDVVLNHHGYETTPSPLALLDGAMMAINLQELSMEQLIVPAEYVADP